MKTNISGIILAITISTIILCSSVASSSLTRTWRVASYGQVIYAPSYTVWTEGGVYYAKDAHGAIAYSSPVASNVLNYASAALTTGGSIFVKNGVYQTTTWNIANPNIAVYGESWNTIFTIPNSLDSKVIVVSADNVTLNNIHVNGNNAHQDAGANGNGYGIMVYGGSYFTIEHCLVDYTWNEGINVNNGAAYGVIHATTVRNCYASGIVFYGKPGATTSTNTRWDTVSDCVVANCGGGGQGADGVFFSGVDYCSANNILVDNVNDAGFEIQSGGVSNVISHGCTASNLIISNASLAGMYLDGSNSSYPLCDPVISNFYISNSGSVAGLLLYNLVNPIISTGNIQGSSGNGLSLCSNSIGGKLSDITINASSGMGAVIWGTGAVNNTLDDICVLNAGSYGIQITSGNTNNVIENSRIDSSTLTGIINYADYTTIENTIVDNSAGGGIDLESAHYCTVSGNRILNPNNNGIYMNASTGNLISNNYISNPSMGDAGIAVSGGASVNNLISGNYITCTTQSSRTGINIWSSGGATGNRMVSNTLYNCATGINVQASSVAGTSIANNQLLSCSIPIIDSGVSTVIYNNTGYNPVGYITNPFSGNNHILLDLGGDNANWSSAETYTNWESPKTLYISGGTVTAVVQNGQTIFATTGCTLVLQPGDTFSITFNTAPTIKVEGQ